MTRVLEPLTQDIRYAVRLLLRNRLFAAAAALSLAIAIGANISTFSVANALLFRPPLGVAEADRLVDIGRTDGGQGFDNHSYLEYLDIRAHNAAFSAVYAYLMEPAVMSLGGPDGAEHVYGSVVTLNYFSTLGARPLIGRPFGAADNEQPGASPIVVISHRLWTRRYQSDRAIVGRDVVINGHPFTVVGVASAGFQGTTILAPDVWLPMNMAAEAMPGNAGLLTAPRRSNWIVIGARLKPGVTMQQAQTDVDRLAREFEQELPVESRRRGLRVARIAPIPGRSAPAAGFIALLMGITALVLAIACANLSGILLARTTTRGTEIAVRTALGAGRGRLIRQMLVETSVLFAIGAAAAIVVTRAMLTAFVSLLPALPVPVRLSLGFDSVGIAFTVILSLAAAMLCGIAPALQGTRSDLVSTLKTSTAGRGARRLRNAFVVAQIAFSLVLVVTSGLFARALHAASQIETGFDPNDLQLAKVDLSLAGYTDSSGPPFVRDVVARVRAINGVRSASVATMLPLSTNRMSLGGFSIPGVTGPAGQPLWVEPDWNIVEPDYFVTMKIPIVRGRDFTDEDRAGSLPVAIVNEHAARQWWQGEEPIGRLMIYPMADGVRRAITVVGVARDTKGERLVAPVSPLVFVPVQQLYQPRLVIVARAEKGRQLGADLRRLVAGMNRNLPLALSNFDEHASLGLMPQRVAGSLAGGLGIVGLVLAAMGIYAVVATTVERRTREIGIRVAVGAQRFDLVALVLRQGMSLLIVGSLAGLALAMGISRLLTSMLFGIGSLDAVAFGGSVALLSMAGLVACYIPCRRALAIDPIEALRHE